MPDITTTQVSDFGFGGFSIPGFEIKCRVGEGGFGEVYLGLAATTRRYRAIKLVRRNRFDSDRPYEIELNGVKLFEEVSREHEGFVDILQVNSNDQAGYFYYVMEVADDLEAQQIDPERYIPRTLSAELKRRGRLTPLECVRVALPLAAALAELHRRNLVHRDVKPGNIVFVRGAPKLADVGLVTEAADQPPHTNLGTADYMDPAVHGTPAGDLYSFGKVLYEMATGLHPRLWPELPNDLESVPDLPVFLELDAIFLRACEPDRQTRYRTALEIHKDLLALQAGASAVRLRQFERAVRLLRRHSATLLILLALLAASTYLGFRELRQKAELRQRQVGSFVVNGNQAVDDGDLLSALMWFAQAWKWDSQREKNDSVHRVRLGSVLQHAPRLEQMWFQERKKREAFKEAFFAGEENQVLISEAGEQWQVYDALPGASMYQPFGMGLLDEKVSLSHTGVAVTSAETNRICLWDYKKKDEVKIGELAGTNLVNAAISPDGLCIAAAAAQDTNVQVLVLWRKTQNGWPGAPSVLGQSVKESHSLIFSPDSRWLLSTGIGGEARVWNVESSRLATNFKGHAVSHYVYNGAFSPDSSRVVTASSDGTARVWERATGTELARFRHEDRVFAAEFNSDGTQLVTACLDSTARIWNPDTQRVVQVIRHNAGVVRATFSPTGKYLLTSCYDDVVRLWSLDNPAPLKPSSARLIQSGAQEILRTNAGWTLTGPSGSPVAWLPLPNQPDLAFWFASDDRAIAATFTTNSAGAPMDGVQCFDGRTGAARGGRFSVPENSELVVGGSGIRLFAFNKETGAVWNTISRQRICSFSNKVSAASFSPYGDMLAVGRGNRVEVFDLENDVVRPRGGFSHPPNVSINAIVWDGPGQRLISSCLDQAPNPLAAQIWDASTGKTNEHALAHRDGVLYAAFSHDGKQVITCGEDHVAILWDPIEGKRLARPLANSGPVSYAAFSNDDRLVATAAVDNKITKITVWSTETGERLTLPLILSLGTPDKKGSIRFNLRNTALIIRDRLGRSYFWELPRYDQSLKELEERVKLLAAQEIDSEKSQERLAPLPKERLRELWKGRGKY